MNIGVVLVTGMLKVETPACPAAKVRWPLLTAPFTWRGWQGNTSELCVTVWFPLLNWNCTTSPTAAVTEFGMYVSCVPPTTTVRSLFV